MQLLSSQFAVNNARETGAAEADARAPALAQRGFQSVFSEYARHPAGSDDASAGPPALGLAQARGAGLQGQLLPQRQTDTALSGETEQAVNDLAGALSGITDTLENLLTLELEAGDGETGPLTEFLTGQLGFTDEAAAEVLATLQSWVAEPPSVAITAQDLIAMGPEALSGVQAMADAMSLLEADINQWLQQVVRLSEETGADMLAAGAQLPAAAAGDPAFPGSSATTAPPERSMLETLQQWSQAFNDGQGGLSQLVTSIAERMKAVLNTATGGSLPTTLDQSRPESALLVQDAAQLAGKAAPAADTLFSQLLQVQAGESKPQGDADSLSLARLTPLAEAVADDARQPLLGGQPVAEKADAVNAVIQRSLQQPLMASDAGRQLGERLALMVRGDLQQATIRLDPPELGMMDVRITVQNDQTQVQIVVQNPQVREALESQSVRLREFLEQQGLSLSKLDIRDESGGKQHAGSDSDTGARGETGGPAAEDDSGEEPATPMAWGQGLVDQFV